MIKKLIIVLLIVFFHPVNIHASDYKYIEIFDPKQAKVVKVLQLNTEVEDVIINSLKNIHSLYSKNDPIPDNGYAVKIPFNHPINIQGKWLNSVVNEVFLIIPENDIPFLIVFENEDKFLCFPFEGDLKMLSHKLDFNLIVNKSS